MVSGCHPAAMSLTRMRNDVLFKTVKSESMQSICAVDGNMIRKA